MKGKTRRIYLTVLLCLFLAGTAGAQLARKIDGIIDQPSQNNVRFSVHVVRADSGETVYARDANRPMIPASNMKIISTAAALKYLGPKYEFRTRVCLWDDALVIIGSGDPLLGDKAADSKYTRDDGWIFKEIIKALKQSRVGTIKGIIVDTSIFDNQRVHPNWPKEQLNRWYACEVSGLNFSGNCIEVCAENISGKIVVTLNPQTSYVEVVNKVVPSSQGSSVIGSYRQGVPNKIVVHGQCERQAGPITVAIENPAAFFGYVLAEKLLAAGISTQGKLVEKPVNEGLKLRPLWEHRSLLADCLARANKDSFGLAAEALIKTIAANSAGGKDGSWETGRAIIEKYLAELGISDSEFRIDDASGLSRENRLSANVITTVLLSVYKSSDWQLYRDSLAVGGVDGTIRKYFGQNKYKGKILGKTGYISSVKSFSGFCSTSGGDYIFSILTENAGGQTRDAINDIAEEIIEQAGTSPPAPENSPAPGT